MVSRLEDVWFSRDFPVLVEVTQRLDASPRQVPVREVAKALAMTEATVIQAAHALQRRSLVTCSGAGQDRVRWFDQVSGEAYVLTGLHPSPDFAMAQLVNAMRSAMEVNLQQQAQRSAEANAQPTLGLAAAAGGIVARLAGVARSRRAGATGSDRELTG